MSSAGTEVHEHGHAFCHEALFYGGEEEFLAGTVPLIRAGLAEDEPVLVVIDEGKIRLLENELDGESEGVRFLDTVAAGTPARGIGEPPSCGCT